MISGREQDIHVSPLLPQLKACNPPPAFAIKPRIVNTPDSQTDIKA